MKTKSIQKATIRKKTKGKKNDYSNMPSLVKREVMGIRLTNATTNEVLEYLVNSIKKTNKNLFVVTPNPEMVVLSHASKDFQDVVNRADVALTDGMQLFNAARFLGTPLKERIIGTDFVERVCEKVEDWPITVGFLGGGLGVAERAAECLVKKFPELKVVFIGTEWDENHVALGQKYLVSSISYVAENRKKKAQNTQYQIRNTDVIDILFVAFGAPKQEEWMAEHVNKIPVRVMIGVGGAFDQIVDSSLRPPAWLHTLGLGWLYRLIREPWRIGRQLKLLEFVGIVIQEKYFQ